jgi:hypothetical protein
MHSRPLHAKLTHHHLLAVCALAIGAIAAAPNDAEVDDASTPADATVTPTPDATSGSLDASVGGLDATVSTGAPEGGSEDASEPTSDASEDGPCDLPTMLSEDSGPTPAMFSPPPNINDGSLDDGFMPVFTPDDGNALAYLGICGSYPFFDYTGVTTPYKDVTGCMAFSSPYASVHSCYCQNPASFTLLQQCDALPTCQAILKASLSSGCAKSGASSQSSLSNSCYLYASGNATACAIAINNAGTGSVATSLWGQLVISDPTCVQ